MRINKVITWWEKLRYTNKFSQPILQGNVWRSVWRICIWIFFGCKGYMQGKNWFYTVLIDPDSRATKIANLESSLKICFIEFLKKKPAVLLCPKDFCQLPVTRLIKIYDSIKGWCRGREWGWDGTQCHTDSQPIGVYDLKTTSMLCLYSSFFFRKRSTKSVDPLMPFGWIYCMDCNIK